MASTSTSTPIAAAKALSRTATAARAAESLRLRSVHLRIHPIPKSFAARREVLRVIERFGGVEMFRSLKYDHRLPLANSFLTIFETAEAARRAVNASPISYRLIPSPSPSTSASSSSPSPSSPPQDPSASSSPTSTTPTSIEAQKQDQEQEQEQKQTPNENETPQQSSVFAPRPAENEEYTLKLTPSTFSHPDHILESPLYGPYPPSPPRLSLLSTELNSSIPRSPSSFSSPSSLPSSSSSEPQNPEFNPGPARPGLLDWATDSLSTRRIAAATGGVGGVEETLPFRVRSKAKLSREKMVAGVMRGVDFDFNDQQRKGMGDGKGKGGKALNVWGLWERGRRAREGEESRKLNKVEAGAETQTQTETETKPRAEGQVNQTEDSSSSSSSSSIRLMKG